jgi:hypothetical protein
MPSPALALYTLTTASARRAGNFSERAERSGWDGMAVVDSQNLSGDCLVALATARNGPLRVYVVRMPSMGGAENVADTE